MTEKRIFELTVGGSLSGRYVVLPGTPGTPIALRYDPETDRWHAERDGIKYERPGDLSGAWVEVAV